MGHYFKWLGSREQAKELWENREALNKYLARLKELMEEDEKIPTLPVQNGGQHISEQTLKMPVRAKFGLVRYEQSQWKGKIDESKAWTPENVETKEMRTMIFQPVYGNSDPNHENTKFWKSSPSGELRLGTVNKEVWPQFELGKEYYLDFTEAG